MRVNEQNPFQSKLKQSLLAKSDTYTYYINITKILTQLMQQYVTDNKLNKCKQAYVLPSKNGTPCLSGA